MAEGGGGDEGPPPEAGLAPEAEASAAEAAAVEGSEGEVAPAAEEAAVSQAAPPAPEAEADATAAHSAEEAEVPAETATPGEAAGEAVAAAADAAEDAAGAAAAAAGQQDAEAAQAGGATGAALQEEAGPSVPDEREAAAAGPEEEEGAPALAAEGAQPPLEEAAPASPSGLSGGGAPDLAQAASGDQPPTYLYVDAGVGGAQVMLAREVGGRPHIEQLGEPLPSVPELGSGAAPAAAGEEEEPVEVLMKKRADFVGAFASCLGSVAADPGAGAPAPQAVVLGLPRWHRVLDAEEQGAFEGLWDELRLCAEQKLGPGAGGGTRLQVLRLTEEQEAHYEFASASFAAKEAFGAAREVGCVLGMDSEAVRCTCAPQPGGAVSMFSLPAAEGAAMLASVEQGMAAWESKCADICASQLAPCAMQLSASKATSAPLVVAVGDCWRVACAAGLANVEEAAARPQELVAALAALGEAEAKPDAAGDAAVDLARVRCALSALISSAGQEAASRPACEVVFARDWPARGQPFRLSWCAGHFLEEALGGRLPEAGASPAGADRRGEEQAAVRLQAAQRGRAARQRVGRLREEAAAGAKQQPHRAAEAGEAAPSADDGKPAAALAASAAEAEAQPAAEGEAAAIAETPVGGKGPAALGGDSSKPPGAALPPASGPGGSLLAPQRRRARGPAPGAVIYVITPVPDRSQPALSREEFAALSVAAQRSGAAIVFSAPSPSLVAEPNEEEASHRRALRPLARFAAARFQAPGARPEGGVDAAGLLFDALDARGSGSVSLEEVSKGLCAWGFPGDAAAAAAAAMPAGGAQAATRAEFCEAFRRVNAQPQLVGVCAEAGEAEGEDNDGLQEVDVAECAADLFAPEALATKGREAQQLAASNTGSGFGVVLVLSARGRRKMEAREYERQMRSELAVVSEVLPRHWPLLWCPGPPELGLLPASEPQRPSWAMPPAAPPGSLVGWLRYLLAVRPAAPAA